jgi:hypothetical protein
MSPEARAQQAIGIAGTRLTVKATNRIVAAIRI